MIQKSNMHVDGKSDGRAVPTKCLNKSGNPLAEGAEGRRPTKENTEQTTASQTQSWGDALSGLRGVREAAKRDKRLRFTALLHHVSVLLLESSCYALKRDAAPGVDGVTWTEYETGLGERLKDLHSRVHRGTYRAQPSKRTYIPKADGRQRPLGIAALEDKIVVGPGENARELLADGFEDANSRQFLDALRECSLLALGLLLRRRLVAGHAIVNFAFVGLAEYVRLSR